jgi:hypothetical protein
VETVDTSEVTYNRSQRHEDVSVRPRRQVEKRGETGRTFIHSESFLESRHGEVDGGRDVTENNFGGFTNI